MRKNYIIPVTETVPMHSITALCVSIIGGDQQEKARAPKRPF